MKPTQEQVIAWAKAVGMERCDCEPRCHLHTGGMGSLTALVNLAYEAGRKDENEACAKVLDEMAAKDKLSNYYKVAALAIRERGAP